MEKIAQKIRVTGRVQGVFFRDSTRQQAETQRLTGYAANLNDGSVEILLQGEPEAVEKVLFWIKAGGPPAARVDSVTCVSCALQETGGFTVR
ncbi:acylphosphatase [Tatumella ptyseos]|uniref:Acylphosphatase n=2 Tax=Tatumella ptyseos TaxID=82987 RepID=A0A085JCF6_9GAMM|nr:acylphosphatase [Tatumella ptyseos]KFD18152.1 putative acylphosphate phosphohydrolase [Tatumella ptyseos ATCC 33301]SQK74232.1 Acylphosphatase [Tatumella ptyseos]